MIQHHTVELNNVQLHYAEAPGPGPALLIVHGLTGSHAEFLRLVPSLAEQAHVYLLDLRGHGLSGWTESGYRVADYARDVVAFLQQVVDRPAILMGHSLGALVATWLAANAAHLLQGIVLEDPPFYILQMPRFTETGFYPYFVGLRDYLGRYHADGGSLEQLVAYVGQTPVNAEQPPSSQAFNERVDIYASQSSTSAAQTVLDVSGPDLVRERAIQLHQVDPAVLEPALAGTLLGSDEPDGLLAQVRCPAHLVAAQVALGGAMSEQDVQRAASNMPHCTYAVIEGAGHDIHLDQPEVFARELNRFLEMVCLDQSISYS